MDVKSSVCSRNKSRTVPFEFKLWPSWWEPNICGIMHQCLVHGRISKISAGVNTLDGVTSNQNLRYQYLNRKKKEFRCTRSNPYIQYKVNCQQFKNQVVRNFPRWLSYNRSLFYPKFWYLLFTHSGKLRFWTKRHVKIKTKPRSNQQGKFTSH